MVLRTGSLVYGEVAVIAPPCALVDSGPKEFTSCGQNGRGQPGLCFRRHTVSLEDTRSITRLRLEDG